MDKTWRRVVGLAAVVALLFCALPVAADSITSEQAQQIIDELKGIRKDLEQRPLVPAAPAPGAPVDSKVRYAFPAGGMSVGSDNAPLVLVEYTDYQCPFCQRFQDGAFAQIKTNYIDTGKLRFVSRDFPLEFHQNARRAAVAGRCAAEQGKYWEMRQTIFANAGQLQPDNILADARKSSLDVPKFKVCADSDQFKPAIDKDIAEGTAAGITGTPSFVLGHVHNGNLDGVRIVGAMPYAQFDAKIQEMLKQAPTARN